MKADLHPQWYADATVSCQCGNTWITGATVPEIRTEICSACHPFYTGEQRIVDTEGRVEKFMSRLQQRDRIRDQRVSDQAALTPMDLPIEELELSKRHVNILKENNINVVQDVLDTLSRAGEDGLLEFTGIGRQAVSDITKSLRSRGYEISEPEEEAAQ